MYKRAGTLQQPPLSTEGLLAGGTLCNVQALRGMSPALTMPVLHQSCSASFPFPQRDPPPTWPPSTSAQHEGYPVSASQAPAQCMLQVRH